MPNPSTFTRAQAYCPHPFAPIPSNPNRKESVQSARRRKACTAILQETDMDSPLRWGIIGTGRIAAEFARALEHTDSGNLVAVASRTAANAERFGEAHAVERRHTSYDALVNDAGVDAVYISTPHPMHAEWAIKSAEAGKHILCEKPMTLNEADTMAVVEAARRNDVFLMEAFMYRCHPQTEKLVELLRSGIIGDVKLVRATFGFAGQYDSEGRDYHYSNALGGGGILDVGCYAVSMSRLVAAVALGVEVAEPRELHAVGHVGPETRIDEYTAATLKFDGDIVAEVACGVRLAMDIEVRIYGSAGRLVVPEPWFCSGIEGGTSHIEVHRGGQAPERIVVSTDRWLYAIEADHVAENVGRRQAGFPGMTWEDSLANARALDRWRDAIGMKYDAEQPSSMTTPVHGRPLVCRSDARMTYGGIDGVDKPVSRIAMGTVALEDLRHASVMFDDFFELGGNCFDTAYVYGAGRSETTLGHWLRNRRVRDQAVVVTKGGHTPHCYPDAVTSQLTQSLDNLGTDHVDIYLLHRDNPEIPVGEFIDVLSEHAAAGRIRAFGASNWTVDRFDEANEYAQKHGRPGFAVLSNNFSLARMHEPPWPGCLTASAPESRTWLEARQVPLLSWSSQAQGYFAAEGQGQSPASWHNNDNNERRNRARTLANEKRVEPTAIALAYALAQPFPVYPVIGPATMRETASSFEALTVQITPAEAEWLDLARP